MIEKFNYLKKYIPGGNEINDNWFLKVDLEEIEDSEKKAGQILPDQLKNFYLEIGHGMLRSPHNRPKNYKFYSSNEILPPNIAVDYMLGILEHPDDDAYYMSSTAHEMLQPGDLPFFEIADGSSFMVMKLNSDNPNAVWYMGVEKIEDSLERFIWRLYHEAPDYYTKNW